MTDEREELAHLERIARHSLYASGISATMVRYAFRIFQRFICGRTILEVGPAEGVMTELLADLGLDLTLVEGSSSFCEDLQLRFPDAKVIHGLIENVPVPGLFDNIVLGHVLEHVEDPVAILKRARAWLTPGGQVLAAVPNARSLHRQAAVSMGLLEFEEQLNDLDKHHGHRRIYNPETFRRDFLRAGFRLEVCGGYWIKPLSNAQLEASWSDEMILAFMQLGERYPDIAAELYIIARV
jgi:2-polyprenyl-3-methyl-5-hydroxy-6-metoxy-1,4-benzoquinol methylase